MVVSNMEVDLPSATTTTTTAADDAAAAAGGEEDTNNVAARESGDNETEPLLEIHPLAIVHMSDQFTRITCGGSPLSQEAPVVGLLFGKTAIAVVDDATNQTSANHGNGGSEPSTTHTLQINDADDIPTELTEATAQQVSLHQAVFPQHTVVGWYRVIQTAAAPSSNVQPPSSSLQSKGSSSETTNRNNDSSDSSNTNTTNTAEHDVSFSRQLVAPTEQDLDLTQQLHQHYSSHSPNFVFTLLQVPNNDNDTASSSRSSSTKAATTDDPLPLSIYQVQTIDNSAVLVAWEGWQLETSEPERIAVERVVQEQPKHPPLRSSKSGTSSQAVPPPSAYATHLGSIETSLEAMKDRLSILVEHTRQLQLKQQQQQQQQQQSQPINTASNNDDDELTILRDIQTLVYQLGPIEASLTSTGTGTDSTYDYDPNNNDNGKDDAVLLSHLGVVAKTVCAVQGYTEKLRTLHEGGQPQSSARRYLEGSELTAPSAI